MFVFVKTLTGKTLTIEVNESDTISETKNKIQQRSDVPASQQRIVFAGKDLEDSKTLEECGVKKESIIHLVIKKKEEVVSKMSSHERNCLKVAQESEALQKYYNVSVGLNEELEEFKDEKSQFDGHANPAGVDFDLGKDGKFKKFRVVLGSFYSCGQPGGTLGKPAEALKKKGFQILSTENEKVFIDNLHTADVAVLLSGSGSPLDSERFVKEIVKFHQRGGGLFLMGDNDPYFAHINLLLPKLLSEPVSLIGNTPGARVLTLGDSEKPGKFAGGHLITSGIIKLYEGVTISYPNRLGCLKVLATSSNANPIICYADNECLKDETVGRIVLDGGFTKCYCEWDTAGTARYIINTTIWLLGLEQKVANNQPILSRQQILRREKLGKDKSHKNAEKEEAKEEGSESEDEDDFGDDLKIDNVSNTTTTTTTTSSSSLSSSSSTSTSNVTSSTSTSKVTSENNVTNGLERKRSITGSILNFFNFSKQA